MSSILDSTDSFVPRHIGPSEAEIREMLDFLGYESLDSLTSAVVPANIQLEGDLDLPSSRGEAEALEAIGRWASRNRVVRSLIGQGYHDTIMPPVIQRNILENPGWYTAYTPYQAEIAQGRLEALFIFQTLIADLTGLPIANASLLDEGTAAAEAMGLCHSAARGRKVGFFVAEDCHPQTIEVVKTRARPLGIEVHVGAVESIDPEAQDLFGVLVQYPATDGRIVDYAPLAERLHDSGVLLVMAADLLSLSLLRSPGEIGADVAVGSAQRFGVSMGYGGPHAGFLATSEQHKRRMAGRIIGLSKDSHGRPAYRMALQTREQHIRREKATSNICTSQVLLAVLAAMYAVWHGPKGLERIAKRIHAMAAVLAEGLRRLGHEVDPGPYFDTLRVRPAVWSVEQAMTRALQAGFNLRDFGDGTLGIALDEKVSPDELKTLLDVFSPDVHSRPDLQRLLDAVEAVIPEGMLRSSEILGDECFHVYHGEHEMLRFLRRLESKDLSLTHSMIPLGSCTMKLNATAEMIPITWPEFASIHPFAPVEQAEGYHGLFRQLEGWLAEITGFAAVSLQPNAGSQGEYSGLLTIRGYQEDRGEGHRDVCLIPSSAHGTNPASATMAGLKVVQVACNERGDVEIDDLETKARQHADRLSSLMITYPSTHGIFESGIRRICEIVHEHGGQVYLDGANMNAQVGLSRPGDFGADVCHLNLHKTFAIPHGGGGPGVGPIGVADHLAPYLPGHPVVPTGGDRSLGPVAAAPWGSAGILPISWMYIAMLGAEGLKRASQVAILNANYMEKRLCEHFPVLYSGQGGLVGHEFIIDLRPLKETSGISVDDVAKRLMDYGFHAPTMSFPVAGTLMIEPTESESRAELDRLCDALIAIRGEIGAVEEGRLDGEDNPLKHAPHTVRAVTEDAWPHGYAREVAAYPAPWLYDFKFWPAVGRIDNAWGDRNLICACGAVEEYAEEFKGE